MKIQEVHVTGGNHKQMAQPYYSLHIKNERRLLPQKLASSSESDHTLPHRSRTSRTRDEDEDEGGPRGFSLAISLSESRGQPRFHFRFVSVATLEFYRHVVLSVL